MIKGGRIVKPDFPFLIASIKTILAFLYYVLSQNVFFDYMMAGANGTKMPRGNKKLIPDFEFLNF